MRNRSFIANLAKLNNAAAKSIVLPLVTAVVVALTSGSVANAEENSGSTKFSKRLYINGGVGVTQVEPESPSEALTISENSSTGGHLGIGYDLNRFLTVEGYVADLGEADIDFLGAAAGTVGYQVFGLSLLGYVFNTQSGFSLGDGDTNGLFRREGLSLYGRAGLGHMRNDSEQVTYLRDYPSHAAFGVGLEYGFQNGFALRTELMSMDTDAKYLNVGVLKRFGGVAVPAAIVPAAVATVEPKAPVAPPVQTAAPLVPPYLYFQFDLSELTADARQKLDTFAAAVKNDDRTFFVNGHTDWIAPEQYNMSLSVRRAEAVANYLVGQGIDRKRITTMGYGETRPISNNNTENGRTLNRRAEIQMR